VYEDKYLFHGPRFQCVTDPGIQDDRGFLAELTALPRHDLFASRPDPELLLDFCTLDGVGQMVGLWLQARDMMAFPLSIRKVEFYGPSPEPGTRVFIRGEMTDLNKFLRTVTAHLELYDDAGRVWVRIEGWIDWILTQSRAFLDFMSRPARHLLGTAVSLPGVRPGEVCVHLSAREWNESTQGFLSGLALTTQERAVYKGLPAEGQRTYLLGRIAARDAVRQWYFQKTGATALHPLALEIVHDARGRPEVRAPGLAGPLPQISIAHTKQEAVALATDAAGGIDIELVSRDVQSILAEFASPQELAVLHPHDRAAPEDKWPLRLWCAKEALGKALGTGLNGRPADFQLLGIQDGGALTLRHGPTAREYEVFSVRQNGFIISHARV
jgi:phosphopantetheinyl transferase